jgi:hypothetical protein
MAEGPVIETPKGRIMIANSGKAELSWNVYFRPTWEKRYSTAQKFVDSEIIRLSEPYIPLRTGMLIKSGTLGTHIGSGLVAWIAIYARANYYSPRKVGTQTGPLRGPFWFERMKKTWGKKIMEGAKKLAGGSTE